MKLNNEMSKRRTLIPVTPTTQRLYCNSQEKKAGNASEDNHLDMRVGWGASACVSAISSYLPENKAKL